MFGDSASTAYPAERDVRARPLRSDQREWRSVVDAGGGPIDGTLRQLRQMVRGRFFLAQDLLQQTRHFMQFQCARKSAQRFVQRDLVLLDLVALKNQRGIQQCRTIEVSDHLVALLDNDTNGFVFLRRRTPVEPRKYLLQMVDMSFGFDEMKIQNLS